MPLRGERTDRPTYDILRSIHGGSVGQLKECTHKILGERCVQKTISILGLEDSIAYLEPRILHRIRHSHVVPVYEAQYDPDHQYSITFVMPKYEGGSIEDLLIDGYGFSLGQAIKFVAQAADALAHVHQVLGYIHRDVKAGNIFTDADVRDAYVGDFGSAAEMDDSGRVEAVEGTLLFTPPEGGPVGARIDRRSDIYQLGLLLYEMASGRFLYEDFDPALVEKRLLRGQRAFRDTEIAFLAHVPAKLRRIIRKASNSDPDRRFASCSALIAALETVHTINWRLTSGDGRPHGEWEGSWPKRVRPAERRRYRVWAEADRLGLRLTAMQSLRATDWRRFGVRDRVIGPSDYAAQEAFFAEVATRAAHLLPAR